MGTAFVTCLAKSVRPCDNVPPMNPEASRPPFRFIIAIAMQGSGYAHTFRCIVLSQHHVVHIGGPFSSTWRMHSPSPVPYCDTILCLPMPPPKAPQASSLPAWLKEPQLQNPRCCAIGKEAKVGVDSKWHGSRYAHGRHRP